MPIVAIRANPVVRLNSLMTRLLEIIYIKHFSNVCRNINDVLVVNASLGY